MDFSDKTQSKRNMIPLIIGIISIIFIGITYLSFGIDPGWITLIFWTIALIASLLGIIVSIVLFVLAIKLRIKKGRVLRVLGLICNLPATIFTSVLLIIIIISSIRIPIVDSSISVTEGFEGIMDMEVNDKEIDKKTSKKIARIANSYNVEYIEINNCTIQNDADFSKLNLSRLYLNNCTIENEVDLSNLNLRRLNIDNCVFEEGFDYDLFSKQEYLYFLSIGNTNISNYYFLGEMGTIESIHFHDCLIEPNGTIILPPNLKKLTVNECNISDGSFFTNSNLLCLNYVDLSGNKLEEVSFLDSPNSEEIYTLKLNDNLIIDASFLNSPYTQGISKLYLSNNPIEDAAFLDNLEYIRELDLTGTSLQSDCVDHICKLTKMEKLWMPYIPMTDLRVIKDMENLKEAYFSGCGISSWDNAYFSNKHKIEYLDLSNNKLSSTDGISELLTYSETSLELILKNNELTFDKKVEYDAEEFRALYLDLSNNKITSLENLPETKEGYYWKLKLYGNKIDLSDEKNLNWLYNNEIDLLFIDYSDDIKNIKMDHFSCIWISDNPDSDEEEKLEAEYEKIVIDRNPNF